MSDLQTVQAFILFPQGLFSHNGIPKGQGSKVQAKSQKKGSYLGEL